VRVLHSKGETSWQQPIGDLMSAVSSPAGFRVEPRPPNGFPPFPALMMASPDAIILLIVDYQAATEGQDQ